MSMDTLKAAEDLETAGFDKPKAAAIARAINDHGRAQLVTKPDLDQAVARLEGRITTVEHEITSTAARLESMMWKQTIVIAVAVAAIASLLRLFG